MSDEDVIDSLGMHAAAVALLGGLGLDEYGHHSAGFYIGGMKRVLRAERHEPPNG